MTEGARDNSDFRKRRRKRIKTIIVTMLLLLIIIPIVLSVFLLFRMNRLERQMETLVAKRGEKTHYSTEVPDVVKAEEKEKVISPAAVEEQPKKVYLTFNDGPSEQTKEVLDVLKKRNVKATFFVIGREDEYSKKMYKRIVKEGHTLGMHSYSHIHQKIYNSFRDFRKDFQEISELLFDVTGVRSAYYRFPGGSSATGQLSIEECRAFFEKQGVTYIDWNVVAANGTKEDASKTEVVRSVMEGVAMYDTSIVLLYDSADQKMTAKALNKLIDDLQAGGYELLPIDENTTPVQHS